MAGHVRAAAAAGAVTGCLALKWPDTAQHAHRAGPIGH
jgi:hypothetical protein